MGSPNSSIVPLSNVSSCSMQLMAVVLPDPFGPSSPNTSPGSMRRLKWSSASTSP